ncbi:MAG: hypothetical protein GTO46_04575 [Gemmatimonadetes bacterium]|nr:hypothetical protein [Gemmatimonadota bacterium]NIO30505.1 hypothetical protein [Gemmatimonadota bacterium]
MYFELTDLLTCPGCGPGFGLVLLVHEVEERRVIRGWLGCPNCRNDFPVENGVADLRREPGASGAARPAYEEEELALKVVALSGLSDGHDYLLLDERLAHAAAAVIEMAPELEVIIVRTTSDDSAERHGISRVLSDAPFPLVEYRLRGVAIAPGGNRELVAAAARHVSTGGRLVMFDATDIDLDEVERVGLAVVAAEGGTVVAERKSDPVVVVKLAGKS